MRRRSAEGVARGSLDGAVDALLHTSCARPAKFRRVCVCPRHNYERALHTALGGLTPRGRPAVWPVSCGGKDGARSSPMLEDTLGSEETLETRPHHGGTDEPFLLLVGACGFDVRRVRA